MLLVLLSLFANVATLPLYHFRPKILWCWAMPTLPTLSHTAPSATPRHLSAAPGGLPLLLGVALPPLTLALQRLWEEELEEEMAKLGKPGIRGDQRESEWDFGHGKFAQTWKRFVYIVIWQTHTDTHAPILHIIYIYICVCMCVCVYVYIYISLSLSVRGHSTTNKR